MDKTDLPGALHSHTKKAVLKGENIDLSMNIKERPFIECSGRVNFPDGEIFTGPVEDSVNGWVRFKYPAINAGQEVGRQILKLAVEVVHRVDREARIVEKGDSRR